MTLSAVASILAVVIVLLLGVSLLVFQGITGVPPMSASPAEASDVVALFKQAGLAEQAIDYDLGCGWGSLVIALAREFPDARIRGIEMSRVPYRVARLRTRMTPLAMTISLIVAAHGVAADVSATQPIAFAIHDGYFVSNKFEPDAPASFVVLKDQKSFDKVFGAAFVMHDKSHRLPPDAFKTKMVAAVIHRGKATWQYTVESVTAEGTTLIVRYATQSTPNQTAEFACPLIISIDNRDYSAVEFVEDGKEIKKLANFSC